MNYGGSDAQIGDPMVVGSEKSTGGLLGYTESCKAAPPRNAGVLCYNGGTMAPEVLPVSDLGGFLSLPLAVSVSQTMLVLIFGLAVALWAVMTVIYLYHWRRFPYGQVLLRRVERLYLGASAVIIVLALGGIIGL